MLAGRRGRPVLGSERPRPRAWRGRLLCPVGRRGLEALLQFEATWLESFWLLRRGDYEGK